MNKSFPALAVILSLVLTGAVVAQGRTMDPLQALTAAEQVDLSNFLYRLEALGFSSARAREVVKRVSVYFQPTLLQGKDASYFRGIRWVLIKPDLAEPGTRKISLDLSAKAMATIAHELGHASLDLISPPARPVHLPSGEQFTLPSSSASSGPELDHWRAVQQIVADLKTREDIPARYRWFRSQEMGDEVAAWYLDLVVQRVVKTALAAEQQGVLDECPGSGAPGHPHRRPMMTFDEMRDYLDFSDVPIRDYGLIDNGTPSPYNVKWDGASAVKQALFRGVLALHPPRHVDELLARMCAFRSGRNMEEVFEQLRNMPLASGQDVPGFTPDTGVIPEGDPMGRR